MILVIACLLGRKCRYDGNNHQDQSLKELLQGQKIHPICPELTGGLPIPRPPAEIKGGDGDDVLTGQARVVNRNNEDVTVYFIEGSRKTLQGIDPEQIEMAILKARSPSCGVGEIYSGAFNGQLKAGSGVTAAYFKRKGIAVYTEEELDKIKQILRDK